MVFCDREFSHVNNMLISLHSQKCDGGRNCQDTIHDIYHHVRFHVTSNWFFWLIETSVFCNSITMYCYYIHYCFSIYLNSYYFSFNFFLWSAPVLERSSCEKLRYFLVPQYPDESANEQCLITPYAFWLLEVRTKKEHAKYDILIYIFLNCTFGPPNIAIMRFWSPNCANWIHQVSQLLMISSL